MTQQEADAIIHEFNQQHAQMNVYEDWSMVALFGVILLGIFVLQIWDKRKENNI